MKLCFDQMPDTVLEKARGGEGRFVTKMFTDQNNKIIYGRLEPGCSIGMHTHEVDSETIYVLSGTGRMLYDDTEEILTAGDCHYCPQHHAHSFINDSGEDLVFFAIIPVHGA